MRNRFTKGLLVAAVAALVWPAQGAFAQCDGNLANTDACKDAQACQKGILDAVKTYVNKVQAGLDTQIVNSTKGSNVTEPAFFCVGGPNNTKACFDNNGVCTGGTAINHPCKVDGDCPASTCNRAANKACNTLVANDTGECQPNPAKIAGAKDYQSAQGTLAKTILSKCQKAGHEVPVADIGFDTSAACPAVGLASTGAAVDVPGYQSLTDCMQHSADGDLGTGKVVDMIMRPIAKAAGNSKPQAKKAGGKQAVDSAPRTMIEIAGSNLLQIGSLQTDTTIGSGGGAVPLSFASCVGGNAAPTCLNNSECAGGVCTRDTCKTCVGGGRAGFGCTALASCPGGTCTGACPANTSIFKAYGNATHGLDLATGNTLTVSQTCAGPLAVCLLTKTKDSGNGTASLGLENFSTGGYSSHAPIETTVVIGGANGVCPLCDATTKLCHFGTVTQGSCSGASTIAAGPNAGAKCSNPGGVDNACPPTTGGGDPKIPNVFNLSTSATTMTAAGGCGAGAAPGQGFCGFCSAHNAIGCQTAADCPSPDTCVCASTLPGAHGDNSIRTIAAKGEAAVYGPTYAGVFCTGKTGSAAVDPVVGLPGPVLSVNPYVNSFVFSKD